MPKKMYAWILHENTNQRRNVDDTEVPAYSYRKKISPCGHRRDRSRLGFRLQLRQEEEADELTLVDVGFQELADLRLSLGGRSCPDAKNVDSTSNWEHFFKWRRQISRVRPMKN